MKADAALGLCCLDNKHLPALAVNQFHQIMPCAATTIDNYLDYANAGLLLCSLDLLPPCPYQQGSLG
jgi:hypothetical protein